MSIIGISGYARSGKDTLADYLCEIVPNAKRIAFADPLKEMVYTLNPSIAEVVDAVGWERAKDLSTQNTLNVRNALQLTGETCRRIFGADIWVDTLVRRIDTSHLWVISDLRYYNEAQKLLSLGATLVRVERPGVGPVNMHVSETQLETWTQWDAIVVNDGSLSKLKSNAHHIASLHTGKKIASVDTTANLTQEIVPY